MPSFRLSQEGMRMRSECWSQSPGDFTFIFRFRIIARQTPFKLTIMGFFERYKCILGIYLLQKHHYYVYFRHFPFVGGRGRIFCGGKRETDPSIWAFLKFAWKQWKNVTKQHHKFMSENLAVINLYNRRKTVVKRIYSALFEPIKFSLPKPVKINIFFWLGYRMHPWEIKGKRTANKRCASSVVLHLVIESELSPSSNHVGGQTPLRMVTPRLAKPNSPFLFGGIPTPNTLLSSRWT